MATKKHTDKEKHPQAEAPYAKLPARPNIDPLFLEFWDSEIESRGKERQLRYFSTIQRPFDKLIDKETLVHRLSIAFPAHHQEVVETSLERMEKKIDKLREEVATKDLIINQTRELMAHHEAENGKLLQKISTLRGLHEKNVAHKRLQRYSALFLAFFSISLISEILLGITIVSPFWNDVGLVFSFGFLLMAWAMGKDWLIFRRKGAQGKLD